MSDKKTLDYQSGFEISQELQNLLNTKEAVIDAIALRKVFKISGDVGAIRSEDLEQLGASPALISQLQAVFGSKLEGRRIEGKERNTLNNLAKNMEAANRLKLEKHAEGFASRLANVTSLKKDDALNFLDAGSMLFSVPMTGGKRPVYNDMGDANASFDNMSNDDYLNYYMNK